MSTTEKAWLISQKATSRCWMFEAACSATQSCETTADRRELAAATQGLLAGNNRRQALSCHARLAHSMESWRLFTEQQCRVLP